MPRRVLFHREPGDPQTVLQDDKDPMLTLDPDYLDCRADTDPAGDLGKHGRAPLPEVIIVFFFLLWFLIKNLNDIELFA